MSQLLATAIEDFDDGCRYTAFESILFVYGYWSGASILAVGYRSDFWNVFVCVCVRSLFLLPFVVSCYPAYDLIPAVLLRPSLFRYKHGCLCSDAPTAGVEGR